VQQADSVVDPTRAIVEAQAILLPTRRSAGPRHIEERFEVSNFRCDPSPFETAPLLQS